MELLNLLLEHLCPCLMSASKYFFLGALRPPEIGEGHGPVALPAHHRPGAHLQHPGQDGEGTVSHALDGEADNVHQGQREEEGGEGDDVAGMQLLLAGTEKELKEKETNQ